MRSAVLVAVAASGCFSTPSPRGDAGDAPTPMLGHHRTISVEEPPISTLDNFPVAVVIDNDASLQTYATAPSHISFALASGDSLPCEVVTFTAATGSLEAWVQLPALSPDEHTFELVYGDDVVSGCSPMELWPMSRYRGVWHLSDSTVGVAVDSSAFQHTLVESADTAPTPSPGVVGGSLRFDYTDTNGADELCNSLGTLDFGTESFSYELWVKQDAYHDGFDVPLTNGGKAAGQAGYDMELGSGSWNAYIHDTSDPGNGVTFAPDATPLMGSWHHLVVVLDRNMQTVRSYFDGVNVGYEALMVDSVDGDSAFCLGDVTNPMVGDIDEVKLHRAALPPDWILETYRNVHEPSTFLQIGPDH